MKKITIMFLLVTAVFLLSCSPSIPTQPELRVGSSTEPETQVEAPIVDPSAEDSTDIPTAPVNISCTLTADCEAGKQCLNGQCGTIEALYSTDCASKCNFEEVVISTSDGETYPLGKGQGSYTAAGALEWKLLNVPDYCAAERAVVPLRIIAKNYGRIVGEYALTLQEGETSEQIIHPEIPSIDFTVTVEQVKESCS